MIKLVQILVNLIANTIKRVTYRCFVNMLIIIKDINQPQVVRRSINIININYKLEVLENEHNHFMTNSYERILLFLYVVEKVTKVHINYDSSIF